MRVKRPSRACGASSRRGGRWGRPASGRRLSALIAAGLVALLGFGSACKPEVMSTGGAEGSEEAPGSDKPAEAASPLPLKLLKVKIEAAAPLEKGPTLAQVESWVSGGLLAEPEFVAPVEGPGASGQIKGSFRAGHQLAQDDSGKRLGAVYLLIKFSGQDSGGRALEPFSTEAFVGEALPEGKDPDEALAAFVEQICAEVAGDLSRQIRAKYSDDEGLVGFLAAREDLALLKPAIMEARARKLRAAAPHLKALLTHDERDIVNLAASALGDVGARTDVPALIDCGSRVSPIDRLPVLYALGQIGGPEAALYLETLAASVDEPALKQAVEQALGRARRPPGAP